MSYYNENQLSINCPALKGMVKWLSQPVMELNYKKVAFNRKASVAAREYRENGSIIVERIVQWFLLYF